MRLAKLVPWIVTGVVGVGLFASRDTSGSSSPPPPPPLPPPPGTRVPKAGDQVVVDLASSKLPGGLAQLPAGLPATATAALVTITSFWSPGIVPGDEPRFNGNLNGYFTGLALTPVTPALPVAGLPVSAITGYGPVLQ